MITVIGTTFTKDDKLEDLTRIVIDEGQRVHIYLGTHSLHMTLEQLGKFIWKIKEAVNKDENAGSVNIQVGDSIEMKDSLGKDN